MKKIVILVGVVLLSSCATDKYLLTSEEMEASPFYTEGNYIMKDSVVVGSVTSTEIEIDRKGNMTPEISITLKGYHNMSDSYELLKYLHTKYPKQKIEINLDGINNFE